MTPILDLATGDFQSRYPHLPFAVRHSLTDNPLFDLSRLLELQKALPAERTLYYPGDVEVNTDRKTVPPTGLSAEETIRSIQEARSWLVLRNIELDATYRELIEQCLADNRPLLEARTSGLQRFQGWIFVTSPGAISPYHFDPEHNFLLQIRGTKTIHVFDPVDRTIVSEKDLEQYYASGGMLGKLEYSEEIEKRGYTFTMRPGDGVYIPISAPHWVKVEDEVSVSFSITWYADEIFRRDRIYRFNARLRKMGLNPTPYGHSPWRDGLKNAVFSGLRGIKRLAGDR